MAGTRIGIGTVGLGWMGQMHSRAYRRPFDHYPECELEPRRCNDLGIAEPYDFLNPSSLHEAVSAMRLVEAINRSCGAGRREGVREPVPPPDPRIATGERRTGDDG